MYIYIYTVLKIYIITHIQLCLFKHTHTLYTCKYAYVYISVYEN